MLHICLCLLMEFCFVYSFWGINQPKQNGVGIAYVLQLSVMPPRNFWKATTSKAQIYKQYWAWKNINSIKQSYLLTATRVSFELRENRLLRRFILSMYRKFKGNNCTQILHFDDPSFEVFFSLTIAGWAIHWVFASIEEIRDNFFINKINYIHIISFFFF